jgi:gliding motility-associated-like protein
MNESIDGVEYKWFFGENGSLGSTDAVNPIWTFPDYDAGTYPVWLYAENIYGCLDSIRYLVVIDGEYQFWVPNTFTPDGDALNDFFGVSGEGIAPEEFVLQIFNRWGELIFESNDPNNPWDGGNAQQGVYAYRIEAVNKYSRIKNEYLGHVTLLR